MKSFSSWEDLKSFIKEGIPALYLGSRTSTVIPFQKMKTDMQIVDLSSLPKSMELEGDLVIVSGPVTWEDLDVFLKSSNKEILVSPTDHSAQVLAGIATSATGERSFGNGTLRDQVIELRALNYLGEEFVLNSSRPIDFLISDKGLLSEYQDQYSKYKMFKNAPFPRLDLETDLLIGTEGQLGIIKSAKIKVGNYFDKTTLFFKLDKWEKDFSSHLSLVNFFNNHRDVIYSCEFFDSNSAFFISEGLLSDKQADYIFIEFNKSDFDKVFELISPIFAFINEENIFEVDSNKCKMIRESIPRNINERNSLNKIIKKGTDVQVSNSHFSELLELYREMSKKGIEYVLFGHIGDCHLHFNFMPEVKNEDFVQKELIQFYEDISSLDVSPFAEHGIGLIKKGLIKKFYDKIHRSMFSYLKTTFDPNNIFFPEGFLND